MNKQIIHRALALFLCGAASLLLGASALSAAEFKAAGESPAAAVAADSAASDAVNTASADALSAPADSANAITVRVAYYPLDGFFEYDISGNECGYGVDYLNELKKYANINWEFVRADSWEGIKPMMLSGQADVRMPVSEPTKPSELYDYSVEPMLTSYHAIMTLASRDDLYYQDYDQISKIKIAACENLLDKTGVGDYLSGVGALQNLVYYPDYNSCRAALDSGRVDALISNVMDLTDDMKLLDKFSVVDNYITTLKGNPCYPVINAAMTRLKLENPSFQSELYEKYYPERVVEPFTRQESEYIANTKSLTVAVYADRKPVSYLGEDGQYHGIAVEIANLLSQKIGIPFEYVPVTTATQPEMLQTADLVMPVAQNTLTSNCFVTGSILDTEILLAVRDGGSEPKRGEKVGVLTTTPGIRSMIEELGLFDVICFDNNREALNALQAGRIKAFANAGYVINWMLENPRYSDLSALRYRSFPLSYDICGHAENVELQAILNKTIRTLRAEEIDVIIQNETKLSGRDFSLADRFYVYRSQIALGALAVLVLLCSLFYYNHSRSRYIARIRESSEKQAQASRAKSDFLARMSHDMRTPLNVIMGMSHLAAENENPPDTNDCLNKINISSEFLLGLINDVLDMEHIESGKIELHPVPYSGREFAHYIDAVIRPLCVQKNIRFEYQIEGETEFVILQDKLRTNQIYFNLLSNAAKFTPEGGRITFHTTVQKTDHGTLRMHVTIADTGIGMKPEFMQRMFEPFEQENQQARSISEGTGLGLAIVKRICDLMGMTISAESTLGKGTTFTLYGEYPVAEPSAAPQPAAPANGRAADPDTVLRGKTFLVCEDHPLNQEIIRRLLEKKGAVIVLADNGKRGVEAFEHAIPGEFAAVLMDIRMPVMDGLEAAAAIRALERPDAKTVPILALTANAYDEDVQKCLAAGMNAHLAKPIDPDELYRILAEYAAG